MKKTILTLGIVLSSSCILFSQNNKTNTSDKLENTTLDTINSDFRIQSTKIEDNSKVISDEGTNAPTTTGSVKKVINGKEVYVKETEINGIKSSVIYEPK